MTFVVKKFGDRYIVFWLDEDNNILQASGMNRDELNRLNNEIGKALTNR